jgi:hypothetical protein
MQPLERDRDGQHRQCPYDPDPGTAGGQLLEEVELHRVSRKDRQGATTTEKKARSLSL